MAWVDQALSLMPPTENPKHTLADGVHYVLHEDHRWVLPLVHAAQENGLLPKPCTVVMFDRHHDALDPLKSMDDLRRLRSAPTLQGVISLCAERLKKNDDDWLKAGMELDFFGDAVIFGLHDDDRDDAARNYLDHAGLEHRIQTALLPRYALLDALAFDKFEPIWSILGWKPVYSDGRFLPDRPKVLLTIDLDCFAIHWGEYTFAWPTKIFEREFLDRISGDWTGRALLEGFAKKAGLVAIARECECCGGPKDAQAILTNLIHYGFSDRISF